MNAAMGTGLGEARALREVDVRMARVVLPEPGMPEMAIKSRLSEGVCWYFPDQAMSRGPRREGSRHTPYFFDQAVDLLFHIG